ncbi:UNVERIFIED_CONTAM: hypothetical protein Sradi_5705500 [Sesamum radiatum]|uniref:Uncharacterized protein n=1 Tax=Sesamum radiatum TaxID=300843 RepID=A0AAW2L337_SESRA
MVAPGLEAVPRAERCCLSWCTKLVPRAGGARARGHGSRPQVQRLERPMHFGKRHTNSRIFNFEPRLKG